MHDIKLIRDNPAAFDAALGRRGLAPLSDKLLALDAARRETLTSAQNIQTERNRLSKEIGVRKSKGEDASDILAAVAQSKDAQAAAEAKAAEQQAALDVELATIPNLPADDVPQGKDENDNVERHKQGEPTKFDFKAKEHADLGIALGMMDFDGAAKISGSRFVVLSGQLARLERALGQFMLDLQTGENGYREMRPPVLVRDHALFGTGQLPKFAEDLFKTNADLWLIPTAEVPLTNLVREQILDEEKLPLRVTALTPCFRAEAGAAGKDTTGMIRQHQFDKVELVSITTPEQSAAEHERMLGCAEEVLKRLGLPYRVITLCTGDMGFGARKTYDIEVWLPGQARYREISSCSNCGDFQARRMDARFKAKGEKGTRFVHTLNGSGLAVGRTLIAVMENYQQADGTIRVPEALKPYMGGIEIIKAAS
ncbi:MAG TPA: serine--tRNA ligase [Alphaproteobacteria bacterium]|nr:serine--tRNA ligase [Alphaproteobacteria bacterium]